MARKLTNLAPEKRKELFLDQLRKEPNITKAARWCGWSRRYVYQLKESDPEFSDAWDEALQESLDLCEAELYRRAYKGTLKPVYQGGEKVGAIREYSDTLLIFHLKAHREKYRDTSRHEHTGKDGGPIKHEDVGLTDTERAARIAALFQTARARRAGQAADEADATV